MWTWLKRKEAYQISNTGFVCLTKNASIFIRLYYAVIYYLTPNKVLISRMKMHEEKFDLPKPKTDY